MNEKRYYLSCLLLFIFTFCFAGSSPQSNNNQENNLAIADLAYKNMNYKQASEYYESYLRNNAGDKTVLSKLGDCYWQMRNYPDALRVYLQLYPNGKGGSSAIEQFRIGELCARQGDYTRAAQWVSSLPAYRQKAMGYSDDDLRKSMLNDTVNWQIAIAGFNTGYKEYSPLLSNGNLLFCSNRPLSKSKTLTGWDGANYSRLWQIGLNQITVQTVLSDKDIIASSSRNDDAITKTKALAGAYEGSDTKINEQSAAIALTPKLTLKDIPSYLGVPVAGFESLPYNVGGISIDARNHLYFSANYQSTDKKGVNRIRIMEGDYDGNSVSNIREVPLGDKNSYSVMHPAINLAGTILVFSSDKPGGMGGYDLYYMQRANANDSWGSVQSLSSINTAGNEVFPYISPKDELYFSSDGRAGLGGLDIYHIALKDAMAGTGKIKHMSAPINSSGDDFGWAEDTTGLRAFITSDRVASQDNIYMVDYNIDKARKEIFKPIIYGYVRDRKTMNAMPGITTFLLNKCEGKVYVAKTDSAGKYVFPVHTDCDVKIKAVHESSSDCLNMQAWVTPPNNGNLMQAAPYALLLDRYPQGMSWRLNNIHYDFDKWDIRADAMPILDSLVTIMKTYAIKVELASFCDTRGTFAYNDILSQKRAEAAVKYIVSKGIDPDRITAKGYGKYRLLNNCTNCTEAEHQENRRTEITVVQSAPIYDRTPFDTSKFTDGQVLSPGDLPQNFFDGCK